MADVQALAHTTAVDVDLEGGPEQPDPPSLILAVKTRHGEEEGDDDAPAIRAEVDEDLCQRSCGIFSHTNPVRRVCFNVMVHPAFDSFVMLLILVSSVLLAIEDYTMEINAATGQRVPAASTANSILAHAEMPLTVAFTLEMAVKIVAMGFVLAPDTYLRDAWNVLDFIVVLAGLVELAAGGADGVKALRTVRVLRPLRTLSRFPGMRALVAALLNSLPPLVNVCVLMLFFFFVFSILAVQLWGWNGALFGRCRLTAEPVNATQGALAWPPPAGMDNEGWVAAAAALNVTGVAGVLAPCVDGATGLVIPQGDPYGGGGSSWAGRGRWSWGSSPWATRRDCVWPVAAAARFSRALCSLPGNGGGHVCPAPQVCGSNFDGFGRPRFADRVAQFEAVNADHLGYGYHAFTTVPSAWLVMMQTITMADWRGFMYDVQDAFNPIVGGLFFIVLIIFGGFFLINLALAAIWETFAANEKRFREAQHAERVKGLFKQLDDRKRGYVPLDDMRKTRFCAKATDDELVTMMREYQMTAAQTGRVSLKEFMQVEKIATELYEHWYSSTLKRKGMKVRKNSALRRIASHRAASALARQQAQVVEAEAVLVGRGGAVTSFRSRAGCRRLLALVLSKFFAVHDGCRDTVLAHLEGAAWWARLRRAYARLCAECRRLVEHRFFERFILLAIFVNTLTLSMDKYEPDDAKAQAALDESLAVEQVNFALTLVFIVEMAVKLLGLGRKEYVADEFNVFDAVIVAVSIVELALAPPPFLTGEAVPPALDANGDRTPQSSGGALSALRTFRLFRVLKLATKFPSLQSLLRTIIRILRAVANFVVLLALFMYIFSLFGMQLFANKFHFDAEGFPVDMQAPNWPRCPYEWEGQVGCSTVPRTNFDTFLGAFVATFETIVDGWSANVNEARRSTGDGGALFFVLAVVIGHLILLNLFLAILLVEFEREKAMEHQKKDFERQFGQLGAASGRGRSPSGGSDGGASEPSSPRSPRSPRSPPRASSPHNNNSSSSSSSSSSSGPPAAASSPRAQQALSPGGALAADRCPMSAGSSTTERAGATEAEAREEKTEAKDGANDDEKRRLHALLAAALVTADERESQDAADAEVVWQAAQAAQARAAPSPLARAPGGSPAVGSLAAASSDLARAPVGRAGLEKALSAVASTSTEQGAAAAVETKFAGPDLSDGAVAAAKLRKASEAKAAALAKATAHRPTPVSLSTAAAAEAEARLALSPTSYHKRRIEDSIMEIGHDDVKALSAGLKDYQAGHGHDLVKELSINTGSFKDTLKELKRRPSSPGQRQSSVLTDAMWSGRSRSLWFIGPDNALRRRCIALVAHPNFDNAVLVLIFVSSVLLAIDNPLFEGNPDLATLVNVLLACDIVLTTLFTFEMLAKVIAKGFALHRGAYLRSGWNVLDFFIVLVSVFSLAAASAPASLQSLRSLRSLRALRPLRMISRNPGMKMVVNALFKSVPNVLNVLMLCLIAFLIFAIVGINYFKGKFYHCAGSGFDALNEAQKVLVRDPVPFGSWGADGARNASYFAPTWDEHAQASVTAPSHGGYRGVTSKAVCEWLLPHDAVHTPWLRNWRASTAMDFNTIGSAIMVVYQICAKEGWQDIMYAAVDAVGPGMQPRRDANLPWTFLFILMIAIGYVFMMNLFVGVVIENFNQLKEQNQGASVLLTPAQVQWLRLQEMMVRIKPQKNVAAPQGAFHKMCFALAHHESPHNDAFERFIMACIIANTAVMSVRHHGQNEVTTTVIEYLNYAFALIYTLEFLIKWRGLGFGLYIKDGWNRFDLALVAVTDVGLVWKFTTGSDVGSFAVVIRVFRVCRIVRLVKKAKGLRSIFNTLMLTLPAMANITSLLFLMYFIYAVLAVQLFSKIQVLDGDHTFTEHANVSSGCCYCLPACWGCSCLCCCCLCCCCCCCCCCCSLYSLLLPPPPPPPPPALTSSCPSSLHRSSKTSSRPW